MTGQAVVIVRATPKTVDVLLGRTGDRVTVRTSSVEFYG